jgi:flagellar protein FliO/FliZ
MTRWIPRWLGPLAFLALFAAAVAAEPAKVIYPGTASPAAPAGPALGSGGALSLVVVLAMFGVGGWILWRGRVKGGSGARPPQLAIAETRALGNRQYLVVATYEDKKFLIGVCPGRIDLLAPLDAPAVSRQTL